MRAYNLIFIMNIITQHLIQLDLDATLAQYLEFTNRYYFTFHSLCKETIVKLLLDSS